MPYIHLTFAGPAPPCYLPSILFLPFIFIHHATQSDKKNVNKNEPANRSGTNIHPNNGVVERATTGFAPNDRCLSLIGETNRLKPTVDVLAIGSGLVNRFRDTYPHTLQNLHWIVLYPSRETESKSNPTKTEHSQRERESIITLLLDRTE